MDSHVTAGETLSLLKRARERLSRPGAWARGGYAFAADGRGRSGRTEDAVRWCAVGAVRAGAYLDNCGPRFSYSLEQAAVWCLGEELSRRGDVLSLPQFNDSQETVEPVLELFDKAIARLEAEAAQ